VSRVKWLARSGGPGLLDQAADCLGDSPVTVPGVRTYFADALRYTNAATVSRITCPAFVTDNETDEVSTGQGKILFDHLTCPKEFRLFKKEEGAEGHCEGMAPIVFWDAAYNWLDSQLSN